MDRHVGLYVRLSPRVDGSYEGLEEQDPWGREYIAATWPGMPVRVYKDSGLSAAKDDVSRSGYEQLRKDMANGELRHLWTVEQSRIERRPGPWFAFAAEMEAAGITELHTRRDGILQVADPGTGIKAVLNGNEVRVLTRRINDKLDARAAAGVPGPVARLFGYRAVGSRTERTYKIVPEEAVAIRWAAERVLMGWSIASIVAGLAEQGITEGPIRMKVRNDNGEVLLKDGRWVDRHHKDVPASAVTRPSKIAWGSVHSWLTSPTVAGYRVHRGEIVGKGNWEPILDPDTWHQVRAVLLAPRTVKRSDGGTYPVTKTQRKTTGRRYLLTGGLARCGMCGGPLSGFERTEPGSEGKVRKRYLACRTPGASCVGILLDETEATVLNRLFRELEQRKDAAGALPRDKHIAQRSELVAVLDEVRADRTAWARDAAAGIISRAEWAAMTPEFDRREQEARAGLEEVPPAPPDEVDWRKMRDEWETIPLDEKRTFLRLYIERVTILRAKPGTKKFDPGRVVITWREAG